MELQNKITEFLFGTLGPHIQKKKKINEIDETCVKPYRYIII